MERAPTLDQQGSTAGAEASSRPASGRTRTLTRPASAAAFIGAGRAYDPHGSGIVTTGGRPPPWLRLHTPLKCSAEVQHKALFEGHAAECAGDFCQIGAEPIREEAPDGGMGGSPIAPKDRGPATFQVPYKSILLARVEKEIPQVGGLANRNRLLESGQPGGLHPADPQKPHPFEFYSGVWVCHHCYVSYCRLDAIRHQVRRPLP